MTKEIDTDIDRLVARSLAQDRHDFLLWSVLPCVYICFGFIWDPLALDGRQIAINFIGKYIYGFDGSKPIFYSTNSPINLLDNSLYQVNSSDYETSLALAQVLHDKTFLEKVKIDLKFWPSVSLDLDNVLIYTALSFLEVLFQWSLPYMLCSFYSFFFGSGVRSEFNKEQRSRYIEQCERQKHLLETATHVAHHRKDNLRNKLDYTRRVLDRRQGARLSGKNAGWLFIFYQLVPQLFLALSIYSNEHTFLGLPETALYLCTYPFYGGRETTNYQKDNHFLATPCSDRDRHCFGSRGWIGWLLSDQTKCKLILTGDDMDSNLAPFFAEYNRHVTGAFEAGIAFSRQEFPGPHEIGTVLQIMPRLIVVDPNLFPSLEYTTYADNVMKKTMLEEVAKKESILPGASESYAYLLQDFHKLEETVFDNQITAIMADYEKAVHKMFNILNIFGQTPAFEVLNVKPSDITEADVFDALVILNLTLYQTIEMSAEEYHHSNTLRKEAMVWVCCFFLFIYKVYGCCKHGQHHDRNAPKPSAAANNEIPSSVKESYVLSYPPHMKSHFTKSKKAMQNHLTQHVNLAMIDQVKDWFSQQWSCDRSKHAVRFPEPCKHPFVESWDLERCSFCEQKVKPEIKKREEEKKQQIEDEDESMSDQAPLCDRGIKVQALVAFAFEHDCWDKPTKDVVRDIIKPATATNRCRYCDLPEMNGLFGSAQVFISHCWGNNFGDLVMAACRGANSDRIVWIDIFAVRQWPGNKADLAFRGVIQSSDLKAVITSLPVVDILHVDRKFSISAIASKFLPHEGIYSSPHPWSEMFLPAVEEDPDARKRLPFNRLWCIVELASAVDNKKPIIIRGGRHYQRVKLSTLPGYLQSIMKVCKLVTSAVDQVSKAWYCTRGSTRNVLPFFWMDLIIIIGTLTLFNIYDILYPRPVCFDVSGKANRGDGELGIHWLLRFYMIMPVGVIFLSVYHYRFGWKSLDSAIATILQPKHKEIAYDDFGAKETAANLSKLIDAESAECTKESDKTELEKIKKKHGGFASINKSLKSTFLFAANSLEDFSTHLVDRASVGETQDLLDYFSKKTAKSILHAVCVGGRVAVLEMLLDKEKELTQDTLFLQFLQDNTFLAVAAQHNHASTVKILLRTYNQIGPFRGLQDLDSLPSLLEKAVQIVDDTGIELVQVILSFQDNDNYKKINQECLITALEAASQNNCPKVVSLLLEQIGQLTLESSVDFTKALHLAVRHGCVDVVRALQEEKTFVDMTKSTCKHKHLLYLPISQSLLSDAREKFDNLSKDSFAAFGFGPTGKYPYIEPKYSAKDAVEVNALQVAELIHPENRELLTLLGGSLSAQTDEDMHLSCTGHFLLRLLNIVAIPFALFEFLLGVYVCVGWSCWFFFPLCPWWSKLFWYHLCLFLIVLFPGSVSEKWRRLLTQPMVRILELEFHAFVLIWCIIPRVFFLLQDTISYFSTFVSPKDLVSCEKDLTLPARVHRTTHMSPTIFREGEILSPEGLYYRKTNDIDDIFCERVTSKTFDLTVVLKNGEVETHSCMDRKSLKDLEEWASKILPNRQTSSKH